ncbi:hypothetical protein [Spirosoma sp. KNUC1025]|uniref:hypothetical protein n=1 Tax=Spirosoma sp. KNUC1025 TaxID=2894082 RepID=UPI0038637C6D|nr:hypothetical protein LN737_21275 [Spirosoma sp. KNUC1025]
MKKLTVLLLIVLGACSPKTVATFTIEPNRLLYSSKELNQPSTADSIARIKPSGFIGKNLKLTLRNGERRIVSRKTVWGYSDAKGNIWRRFKNDYYQVLRVSDVIEYEVIESRTVGPNMVINEPVKMYSKTLDSKIVGSRKRALQTVDEPKAE